MKLTDVISLVGVATAATPAGTVIAMLADGGRATAAGAEGLVDARTRESVIHARGVDGTHIVANLAAPTFDRASEAPKLPADEAPTPAHEHIITAFDDEEIDEEW